MYTELDPYIMLKITQAEYREVLKQAEYRALLRQRQATQPKQPRVLQTIWDGLRACSLSLVARWRRLLYQGLAPTDQ
jgi:hypothetical protein